MCLALFVFCTHTITRYDLIEILIKAISSVGTAWFSSPEFKDFPSFACIIVYWQYFALICVLRVLTDCNKFWKRIRNLIGTFVWLPIETFTKMHLCFIFSFCLFAFSHLQIIIAIHMLHWIISMTRDVRVKSLHWPPSDFSPSFLSQNSP